ncbi:response regulator [Azospirillum melinis]
MTTSAKAQSDVQGLRLLIVEDEVLVGMALERALKTLGCEVIGPAVYLDKAIALAQSATMDGAILDVNIAGQKVFPVADILSGRGIPFLFATGYGLEGLREGDKDKPVLQKPYSFAELIRIVARWRSLDS